MTSDLVGKLDDESIALMHAIDRDPLIATIIDGSASREAYIRFLEATYHYLRWSGPLLAATAEGLRRRSRYPWLLETLDGKSEEESPHDKWVLDDLRALGAQVEIVESGAAPRAVHTYVQWSLTLADHGSPAYLGAAYVLESISMRRAKVAAENLCARQGIPRIEGAVSFLARHGEADLGHVALLQDVLRSIEDEVDQGAVVLSAAVVRVLYPQFFHVERTGAVCDPFAA